MADSQGAQLELQGTAAKLNAGNPWLADEGKFGVRRVFTISVPEPSRERIEGYGAIYSRIN